jgi:hypothetical protein
MKRTFEFSAGLGLDVCVTLEVDLDVMTPELATEINNFWAGAADVLTAAGDDIIQAAARRAASRILWLLLDTDDADSAMDEFNRQEGWPPNGEHGIRIVDFDLPSMSADDLDCEELQG